VRTDPDRQDLAATRLLADVGRLPADVVGADAMGVVLS